MSQKDQSILFTGGTGLLGSYVLRKLLLEGYSNITAIHRSSSSFDLLPEHLRGSLKWQECDLTDSSRLEELIDGVDIIIHCAAVISFWKRQFEMMHKVNHLATKDLIGLAEQNKVKRFIHISSVEALGHTQSLNAEDSPYEEASALSEYSISKHRAELAVKSSSLNYTIYNPGFILGGAYWHTAPLNFIKKIKQGMRFYPSGSIGVIDVRDIAAIVVNHLEDTSMYKEQFILVSENIKHEYYFRRIGSQLNVKGKFYRLKEPLISIAIFVESMKAIFTKVAPLITRETYRISSHELRFDNKKIKSATDHQFRSADESIDDLCACFKATYSKQKYGILDL